jgi:hypothetical protein
VGESGRHQTLLKITRRNESAFEQEDLGAVAFVPLIGEQGWAEDGTRAVSNHVPGRDKTLPEMIAEAAEPLPDLDDRRSSRWLIANIVSHFRLSAEQTCPQRIARQLYVPLAVQMKSSAEYYRHRALVAQQRAEQTTDLDLKEAFKDVAREWLALAERVDWLDSQHNGQQNPNRQKQVERR